MKIAICDDDRTFAEDISKKIREIENECEIFLFENGDSFLKSNEKWDVVFLDIEMAGMNGFEVAKILNERSSRCVFSFITSHMELAIDGYDYQPYRYILKQTHNTVITRKLKENIDEFYHRNKTLQTIHKGQKRTVYISDIEWIEIEGHCMKISMENEIVLWNKPLREAEYELEKCGVIRCHRSFMVSLAQIKQLNSKNVILHNGHKIPIGRKYSDEIEKGYINFKIAR